MSFLPIATRELRVAARKRSTFWLRVVAAIIGLVIAAAFMLIATLGGFGSASFGSGLFATVTWISLGAAITAGLFFTSDCLSEEKREGTLGFLFLTDLRGYDVVAGKLLATSLRGLFAFLAVFPILAVTLLMGGVTGVQFWKTALALLNALFCSLSVGLFVSAMSHDSQKAMAGTFFWLLVFVALGPIIDGSIAAANRTGFIPRYSLTSPGYLFVAASAWGRTPYWLTLLVTQGIAWSLFGLTSLVLPRTWQQKGNTAASWVVLVVIRIIRFVHLGPLAFLFPTDSGQSSNQNVSGTGRGWRYALKYGGPRRRARIRRKLLDRNPIVWLTCREWWQSLGIWSISILATGGFFAVLLGLPREVWLSWQFLGALFFFAFYLWAASQSCRFFIEARKSGLTELLLAAPLGDGQIVRGQWKGLLRMYGLPVLLLLSLNLAAATLSTRSWTRMTAATGTATTTTTNSVGGTNVVTTTITSKGAVTVITTTGTNTVTQQIRTALQTDWEMVVVILTTAASGITTVANLIALCWFGMWMGLTSKNASFATLKTLLFVQIIPVLVIQFSASMLSLLVFMPMMFKAQGSSSWNYALWPLITTLAACFLSLGKDIFFIVWSRRRLYSSFREQASRSFSVPRLAIPPPIPPRIAAPPLIAS